MLTITPPMRLYVQLNARYVSIVTSALRNDYEKKAQTMMVNNSTNTNKPNNHPSPQII